MSSIQANETYWMAMECIPLLPLTCKQLFSASVPTKETNWLSKIDGVQASNAEIQLVGQIVGSLIYNDGEIISFEIDDSTSVITVKSSYQKSKIADLIQFRIITKMHVLCYLQK